MNFNIIWEMKKNLEMDQRRLDELKCDAYSIGARDLSGMPKNPGFSIDGGRTARYATEIADLEEIILDRKIELVQEQSRLEQLIEAIPDSKMRIIFTMRCIEMKGWKSIHKELKIEDGTVDKVKKLFYRYCKDLEAAEMGE